MTRSPPVAAVVLNWNQAGLTLDCLAALRRSARPVDHLVVVDNGSRPDQRAALAAGLPAAARPVRLPANRGFAGGMNAGLAEAGRLGAEYAWLVNNDAFPDPGCLGLLLAAMDADPTLAAVTPRLVGTDGREQHAGGWFDFATGVSACGYAADHATATDRADRWVIGTAPLVRVGPCARAGGFDDRFFAYMEEIDLCLRLGRQGYRFRAVPGATAVHLGHASTGGNFPPLALYLHTRNQYLLCRKHVPGARSVRFFTSYLRTVIDHAGCFELNGQPDRARAVVQAVFALVMGERGRPQGFGRCPRLAGFVARHPWQLTRALDRFGRRPAPAGGAA
ncbi:MAG: glycosyltransferase family 2 protein [Gemmataceae bacterium]